LKLEGGGGEAFHTPIPIKRIKSIRPVRKFGLTGRSTTEEKPWRGWEMAYQGGEHQILTWNRVFHGGELNSPWGDLGTASSLWEREIDWQNCLGERRSQDLL
jgi:hypothetical protein